MKFICSIIILLSFKGIVNAQCVTNDPYKLYWHRYVLELDSIQVASNKIQSVEASSYLIKKGKQKNRRNLFRLDFNDIYLPEKLEVYQEFNLRKGLKYNPFWRKKNQYPVYHYYQYVLNYDSLHRLQSVIQKERGAFAVDTTYSKLEFQYDSLNRVVLQREFDFFKVNIKGKDTILESPYDMDSTVITYLDNKSGFILSNSIFRRADTIEWKHSPIQYVLFNFGDTTESFIRNMPFDRNSSLYYAIDTNAIIERNNHGLRKSKILNRERLTQGEIVNLPEYTMIVYEYKTINTP